ncbi:MAG: sulfatase-like hydrolase/transferase [Anaerolineales bacterium]|nr:sulfatase-like hydrolase/transferase [Anaerolineales bacterium]
MNMSNLSRRDFLKLAGLASGAVAMSHLTPRLMRNQTSDLPNIIIFVFDAMSARNLSLYGYERNTTPNFHKFAKRANVYHRHRSSGNFTTPGTASLLTGTYPWTHRAINLGGLIARDLVDHNIFSAFGSDYNRLAFSQNMLPNYLLGQFARDIETILPFSSFGILEQIYGESFTNDMSLAYRSFDDFLFKEAKPPSSLVFGLIDQILFRRQQARAGLDGDYGLPPRAGAEDLFFRLTDVFDGVNSTIRDLAANSPFLAYLHLWAPHEPYRPAKEYQNLFQDNYSPVRKPDHRFGDHIEYYKLKTHRRIYDQYIANVDAEFGRLIDDLDKSGVLENSYVVVTSDHGQSLERGLEFHFTNLLYEPLMHIPLLISAPGQSKRKDIYFPTNNVDLLPTLLWLVGRSIPDWIEGKLLPGLGGVGDMERSLFTLEAKTNRAFASLSQATVAMIKGNYKLIYYKGFESEDSFEFYDLENDYEELNDLYPAQPVTLKAIKDELLEKLDSVNAKYRGR